MLRGISTKPKPRRKAPVISPKAFEQAIASPRIPLLQIRIIAHQSFKAEDHKVKSTKLINMKTVAISNHLQDVQSMISKKSLAIFTAWIADYSNTPTSVNKR